MAELVLRLRDREMARVGIVKTRMTVGRDADSDLVIDNAAVSRTHVFVSYTPAGYRVEDNESQNGIVLNGKRVRKAPLDYGDVIAIGKFEIELVQSWHEPMETGGQPSKAPAKNIMSTMQMDAASVAKLRDEAMARIAAQKGLPAPTPRAAAPKVAARAPAAPPPEVVQAVAPAPSQLKLIAIIVASVVAGGALMKLLMQ